MSSLLLFTGDSITAGGRRDDPGGLGFGYVRLIAERRMEAARENYETAIEDYLYVRTHGSSRRRLDARTPVSDEQIASAVARIRSRIA